MSVAADTDDSCHVTVIVEEVEDTDECTTSYKRRKLNDSEVDDVWVTIHKVILRMSDKAVLLSSELDDKIVGAAQKFLLCKFPSLNGLRSTLATLESG